MLSFFNLTILCTMMGSIFALPCLPILVGYMYQQNQDHNACQINGANVQNQIALGTDVFNHALCGQSVQVVVGSTTVQGTVIDVLDSSNRLMVSPDLFTQFAPLDTGIVQGSLILPNINNVNNVNNVNSVNSLTNAYESFSYFLDFPSNSYSFSTDHSVPPAPPSTPFTPLQSFAPTPLTTFLNGNANSDSNGNAGNNTSPLLPVVTLTNANGIIGSIENPLKEDRLGIQQPLKNIGDVKDINENYQHVLYSSNPSDSNDATFYYDASGGPGACGAVNGIKSFPESNGVTYCEKNEGYKTISERGTDNLVAMPYNILSSGQNKALLCGKRIIVHIDGKKRDDLKLFLGDACAKCSDNGGLDFSSNIFAELFGYDECGKGRIPNRMSYEIVDEKVVDWY